MLALDTDRSILYPDFVIALLGAVARKALEQLMQIPNYKFQSDFARKYYAEGIAEGEAKGRTETLLKLLQLRGFTIPEERRQQVLACRDGALLDTWVERVLVARDLDEIFA